MSDEAPTPASILDALLDLVTEAFIKSDVAQRANALKRLRGYLMAIQQDETLQSATAMAGALKEAPRPPGFGSYGPEISRAIRTATADVEELIEA
ncbi:MAG: hypothetical protein KDA24_13750 [Deltaproteobacteria bacterium]|nr:hypothetical protein [Deltaproteobacteria bacterium]